MVTTPYNRSRFPLIFLFPRKSTSFSTLRGAHTNTTSSPSIGLIGVGSSSLLLKPQRHCHVMCSKNWISSFVGRLWARWRSS